MKKFLGFWKKWFLGDEEEKVTPSWGCLSFFLSFFLSLFLSLFLSFFEKLRFII